MHPNDVSAAELANAELVIVIWSKSAITAPYVLSDTIAARDANNSCTSQPMKLHQSKFRCGAEMSLSSTRQTFGRFRSPSFMRRGRRRPGQSDSVTAEHSPPEN
jgi:hypothetical protein